MTTNPRCNVHTCNRPRHEGRPICNRCMRRAGETLVKRWFATKRTILHHPDVDEYRIRLTGIENRMILNATAYQQIKDTGQRPMWNPQRQVWENPRERAHPILEAVIRNHAFGRDPNNDADVIDRLIADLYPTGV
ncbi:hypothetical protein SEA_GANCHO_80 [Mycobacterium phage Gancho]|uniref:Uncharacterized protein n=1 Tax=Mycobacterium phage Gancho TaxID=2301613 RepID=A0A385UD05_9CAUD|nr:hypothetical protein SEA_GANCHO_80 [Mycobacterium phage Gancho]